MKFIAIKSANKIQYQGPPRRISFVVYPEAKINDHDWFHLTWPESKPWHLNDNVNIVWPLLFVTSKKKKKIKKPFAHLAIQKDIVSKSIISNGCNKREMR